VPRAQAAHPPLKHPRYVIMLFLKELEPMALNDLRRISSEIKDQLSYPSLNSYSVSLSELNTYTVQHISTVRQANVYHLVFQKCIYLSKSSQTLTKQTQLQFKFHRTEKLGTIPLRSAHQAQYLWGRPSRYQENSLKCIYQQVQLSQFLR